MYSKNSFAYVKMITNIGIDRMHEAIGMNLRLMESSCFGMGEYNVCKYRNKRV